MTKRILALLVLAAGSVTAEVDMTFTDFKQHRQTSLTSSQYLDGYVFVQLLDGIIWITGCMGQPSAYIIYPNLFCPLGTTGFVAQGDVGNNETGEPFPDGVPDDGSFWSVVSIVPAMLVEPFEVERVKIVSAPPSGIATLLRNSRGDSSQIFQVTDASAVVWYNFLEFPMRQYEVTLMDLFRDYGTVPRNNQWVDFAGDTFTGEILPDPAEVMANPEPGEPLHTIDIAVGDPLLRVDTIYGVPPFNFEFTVPELAREVVIPGFRSSELERHYDDVPWGTYLFEFPALGDENAGVIFGVNVLVSPDVYPGRGHLPQGWRMVNDTWFNRTLEVDPRVFYDFQWDGINFTNSVLTDDLYLSMWANQWVDTNFLTHRSLDYPDPADVLPNPDPLMDPLGAWDIPVGDPLFREDVVVFPPYPAQTPVLDREEFLIGLYDGHYQLGPFFFQPGESAMGRLDFRRDLEAGNATRDTSRRFLEFEISFIDTYEGFSFFSAPLIEGGFPLGTRTSMRGAEGDFDGDSYSNLMEFAFQTDVADPTNFPIFAFEMVDLGGGIGSCSASVEKRPDVGSSLRYQFEASANGLTNWKVITKGSPVWDVVEDETMLMVTNVLPIPGGSCYLRVRVTLTQ